MYIDDENNYNLLFTHIDGSGSDDNDDIFNDYYYFFPRKDGK